MSYAGLASVRRLYSLLHIVVILGLALAGVTLVGEHDSAFGCGRSRARRLCCPPVPRRVPCTAWAAAFDHTLRALAQANEPLSGVVATRTFSTSIGRRYRMYVTRLRESEPSAPPSRRSAPPWVDDGETFGPNHDRRAAKISISGAPNENFDSLNALMDTLEPDDTIATAPGVGEGVGVNRVPAEERNVTVFARLYAASKKSDNDFQCIIGTDDPPGQRRYIRAVISALPFPNEPAYHRLAGVRQEFQFNLRDGLPGNTYNVWPDGIPVRISGSLFFDIYRYHDRTEAGIAAYRPSTYWEIHPVTSIAFEPLDSFDVEIEITVTIDPKGGAKQYMPWREFDQKPAQQRGSDEGWRQVSDGTVWLRPGYYMFRAKWPGGEIIQMKVDVGANRQVHLQRPAQAPKDR
jgi:hypothetical protein